MSPRAIWLCFAISLAVLLAALAWVTRNTLRLEEARQEAARDAEVQEKVRLALWRMDAAASAILIREGARPPGQFRAFTSPSLAWTNTYQTADNFQILIPSPLLTEVAEHVRLHFELGENDALTSPQAPLGNERTAADARFNTSPSRMEECRTQLQRLHALLIHERSEQLRFACIPAPEPGVIPANPYVSQGTLILENASQGQVAQTSPELTKNQVEYSKRATALGNSLNVQQVTPQMKEEKAPAKAKAKSSKSKEAPPPPVASQVVKNETSWTSVSVGQFRASWVQEELILIREVREGTAKRYQGVWLDWPALRKSLLLEINDLFPSASLEAAVAKAKTPASRSRSFSFDPLQDEIDIPIAPVTNPLLFASLPVKLVTGTVKPTSMAFWTPFRRSVGIAWGCVLLAAAAVGVLLRGTVALSERRAAFVSAVTHELRTPLTTFRLYAELLANDMLPTAKKRVEYLATLQAEAERLSHLVENVLAYARLERGRATARPERLTLSELIQRVRPALERRVEQVEARLSVKEGDNEDAYVEVDVAAVEQILFNLVDNACKYAAAHATEKTIHLEAGQARGMALLRVRDHGRGIERNESRRIFRPFHKSAQQAAQSAPGVGLGLALCRKMSRSLGGDVRLDTTASVGACFVLEMPLAE